MRAHLRYTTREDEVVVEIATNLHHQKLMPNGSPLGIFFAESRKHVGVRAETCGLR